MNLLADNLVLLRKEMSSLRSEVKVRRQEKPSGHSDSWLELQGAHNASKLNNVVNNHFILVSPPRERHPAPVRQQMRSPAAIVSQTVPVTLSTLRTQEESRRGAAAQYVELEKESSFGNISGELDMAKRSVKSGRERTGGVDARHVYDKWPQEACYIGPESETRPLRRAYSSPVGFRYHFYSFRGAKRSHSI